MWKAWCEADALCSKLMFLTRDGCLRTVGARAKSGVFFSWQTVANGPGKGEHLRWRVGKKITLGELAFDIF